MDHAEDVLSRAPLFEALDDEGAKALRSLVTDVDLVRAQRLFDEGDAGDRLYVVLDGKIKLTRAAPDGRENLLSVLGPGEMFGERHAPSMARTGVRRRVAAPVPFAGG